MNNTHSRRAELLQRQASGGDIGDPCIYLPEYCPNGRFEPGEVALSSVKSRMTAIQTDRGGSRASSHRSGGAEGALTTGIPPTMSVVTTNSEPRLQETISGSTSLTLASIHATGTLSLSRAVSISQPSESTLSIVSEEPHSDIPTRVDFIIGSVLGVAIVMLTLYLILQRWRKHKRFLAARVLPVSDPQAQIRQARAPVSNPGDFEQSGMSSTETLPQVRLLSQCNSCGTKIRRVGSHDPCTL
ncbi:hypothetical protein PM082_012609 [Marasmius tenuissimus]|nr:hypothetical protein PM082_012609 [Marasmius tenuissimus]